VALLDRERHVACAYGHRDHLTSLTATKAADDEYQQRDSAEFTVTIKQASQATMVASLTEFGPTFGDAGNATIARLRIREAGCCLGGGHPGWGCFDRCAASCMCFGQGKLQAPRRRRGLTMNTTARSRRSFRSRSTRRVRRTLSITAPSSALRLEMRMRRFRTYGGLRGSGAVLGGDSTSGCGTAR